MTQRESELDDVLDLMLDEKNGLRHCCGQSVIENNHYWKQQIRALIDTEKRKWAEELIGDDELILYSSQAAISDIAYEERLEHRNQLRQEMRERNKA